MSRQNKIPHFLYDWRSALVAFPAMFLYCGFLPVLKFCGIVSLSWFWALAPIWMPFVAFWLIVGFICFVVLVTELGFEILPDENLLDGKKNTEV